MTTTVCVNTAWFSDPRLGSTQMGGHETLEINQLSISEGKKLLKGCSTPLYCCHSVFFRSAWVFWPCIARVSNGRGQPGVGGLCLVLALSSQGILLDQWLKQTQASVGGMNDGARHSLKYKLLYWSVAWTTEPRDPAWNIKAGGKPEEINDWIMGSKCCSSKLNPNNTVTLGYTELQNRLFFKAELQQGGFWVILSEFPVR